MKYLPIEMYNEALQFFNESLTFGGAELLCDKSLFDVCKTIKLENSGYEYFAKKALGFIEMQGLDAVQIFKQMTEDEQRNYVDTILNAVIYNNIIREWGKYKHVYKCDEELLNVFTDYEECKIPVKLLEKLRFPAFYIDYGNYGKLQDVSGNIQNIQGTFVLTDTININNGKYFLILSSSTDGLNGRNEDGFTYSNGYSSFPILIDPKDNEEYITLTSAEMDNLEKRAGSGLRIVTAIVFNLILYLCCNNSDVKESVVSKSTYKERDTKDKELKYNDIQTDECGFIYGKTLRLQKEKIKREGININVSENRKAPVPHYVRHHYSHYWTGAGRVNCELRFIEGYYTGGVSEANVATIQKCKA